MGPLFPITIMSVLLGSCVLAASVLFLLTPGVEKRLDSLAIFIASGLIAGVLSTALGIGCLYLLNGVQETAILVMISIIFAFSLACAYYCLFQYQRWRNTKHRHQ
jgi:hypothetical protein